MHTSSILTRAFLTPILAMAQHNLELDGAVAPVLFVKPATGGPWVIAPELPNEPEHRQRYFAKLGDHLRQDNEIVEAVLLMHSWFVNAKQAPAALAVPPSRHPDRQEAITLIGRNADQTRETQVVQPFRRNADQQLVWEKRPLEVYNRLVGKERRAKGLLDYLFDEGEGG